MKRNDEKTTAQVAPYTAIRAQIQLAMLKFGLGLLVGFWLTSAHGKEIFYRTLIIDDPTPEAGARFSDPVAGAGDINSDGIPDLLVGAPFQDVNGISNQGQAFVFSGADRSLLLTLDNPTSQVDANFGWALDGAGDVNGDDIPDLLVGARNQDINGNSNQGQAFVFSGADGHLLLTLNDPIPQAGDDFFGNFGEALAGVGDVNGDGSPDLLIGAPYQDVNGNIDQGQAFVFSGADGSLLLTLDDPAPNGVHFGFAVAGAGDVNGDDRSDLLVGAPEQIVDGNANQGQAFVFSGADGSLLLNLDNPRPQGHAFFAQAVAGAEDVDGDDVPDLLVGAPGHDVGDIPDQGQAFVFSGADGHLLHTLDNPSLQRGLFGFAVDGAGDVNGDGLSDLLVGAGRQDVDDNVDQGQAFVFSGANGRLLKTLDNPTPQKESLFGWSVAGVGDVNGDGLSDLLAGAIFQDVGGNVDQGQAVLFVSIPTCFGRPATIIGTQGNDILHGTSGIDVIVGLGGDDVIEGLSGDDLICGGPGNDRISGNSGNDQLSGDEGSDSLAGGSGDDQMDGGAGQDRADGGSGRDVIRGGEDDDVMTGGSGNDLIEGGPGQDQADGESGSDIVRGGEGDDLLGVLDCVRGNDTVDGGPQVSHDTCLADPGDTVLNCNP